MITICEECGKKYRINTEKVKGKDAHFKCKVCGHLITIQKSTLAPKTQKPDDMTLHPTSTEPKTVRPVAKEPIRTPKSKKVVKKKKVPKAILPGKIRFGLTAKLFSMMIIVSLLPLGIFSGIILKHSKDRIRNEAKINSNQISIGIAKHVDEWLDKNVRLTKTFASMRDMISMNRFLQEPLLNTILKVYPSIYLSHTIDLNGMNIARSDGKPLINYSDKQYFKDVLAGKTVAWQTMIDKSLQKPSLVLAVPIKKGDNITGILVNAIRLDDLSRRIVTWTGGDTGSAFLVDEQGKVIAHKIDEYVRKQKNFRQHPLVAAYKSGKRGPVSFTNNEGKLMLGHVRGTAFGWILAIQQEESEAFYLIDHLMSYAYLLLGVTAVFVFIIAWFSGRALSRPIIKLTHVADRISMGELDVEISTKRNDEIGNLAEAIARMQDSIRLSIERLRQRR